MIKLSSPYVGKEEFEEIKKVLDSGYLVQGEKVQQFELMVSEYLNVKYCIAVSSGTAALHLALLTLGIGRGDEVIVPDFTFPATANVVEFVGASAKLVDIRPDSFCIDTGKIEASITDKTKAILPVHEFGQCADMDTIKAIAQKYNLKIIEDAACALGSEYKGRKAGTLGHISCFSFHPRKAITTGEGGMLATDNEELAQMARVLRNHGINNVNGKLEFTAAGLNYRMTDLQASMGIAQMKKLEAVIEKRRYIAAQYGAILKNIESLTLPYEKEYGRHTYQTYHIILSAKVNRDLLKEQLLANGIECNIGAYALHQQLYYREKYRYAAKAFPESFFAYKQGLALPLHNQLSDNDIKLICHSLISL